MLVLFSLIQLVLGDTDGPWNILGFSGVSGEITVNGQTGSSLFFWQFNSVRGNISTDSRPLVIWSQGGPGCSSLIGMLAENISPLAVDSNGNIHTSNSTWALNFHLLAIDFPFNSGYSYASLPPDLVNSTDAATDYLYRFLAVLGTKYPTWFNRDVYWFGEDYAGHFIPSIATKILYYNANPVAGQTVNIRLRGIGLGSPFLDAYYQTQYFDSFTYNTGLANTAQSNALTSAQSLIRLNITLGNYDLAFMSYLNVLNMIESYTGKVNVFNMRTYSDPGFPGLYSYLNLANTKQALNVPPAATWDTCANLIPFFGNDSMLGFVSTMMPNLLANLKVLIFNGQDNLYENNFGLNFWLKNLQWQYTQNFLNSRRSVYNVAGSIAGYVQTYNNLTYVQILKAGNQAVLNQPFVARDMAFRFILNQGWN